MDRAVPLGIEIGFDIVTVTFTNNGTTAVGEPFLISVCDYELDGREAKVQALVATSCLGGCPEVEPGAAVDFEIFLNQVRYADALREPVPAGAHSFSITCPDAPPATEQIEFP